MAGAVTKLSEKLDRHGRGESEGLSFDPTQVADDVLMSIPLDRIEPDPDQPRRDRGGLAELAISVEEHGILQPIVVSKLAPGRFRIVAGERRYTAAKQLGLATIPALVRSIDAHRLLEVQVVENVHRKDLDPFEEAGAYQRLLDEFGYTQEELAAKFGKNRVVLNEILALTRLPDAIRQEYVRMSDTDQPKPSRSVLLEVAKADSDEAQQDLWQRVKSGYATVRQLREVRASARPASRQSAARAPKRVFTTSRATVTIQLDPRLVSDAGECNDAEAAGALEEALQDLKGTC